MSMTLTLVRIDKLFSVTLCLCGLYLISCESPHASPVVTDSLHPRLKADSLLNEAKRKAYHQMHSDTTRSQWGYVDVKDDKMKKITSSYAIVSATELIQLKPQNSFGSEATLTLCKKRGKTTVSLSVSQGQFNVNSIGDSILVRFDRNPPESYPCIQHGDGDSTFMFIKRQDKFTMNLKKAKKLLIEAEFRDNGIKQIEFYVAGTQQYEMYNTK